MNDQPPRKTRKSDRDLAEQIGAKASLKIRARRSSVNPIWLGFGMMGLIGWSVVVPTLLGAVLGIWLDKHHPGKHAWTLALMAAGLAIGCFNAWSWIAKEESAMREEQQDDLRK